MMNHVSMGGRLTRDPKYQVTQSGIPLANFSIAVQRNYRKEGAEPVTDFFNCQAWRYNAEFINKYFHQGDMIYIEGSLENSQYKDREGNNRTSTYILVDHSYFGGRKGEGGGQRGNQNQQSPPAQNYTNRGGNQYSTQQNQQPNMYNNNGYSTGFTDIPDDGELPF